jgi:small-conductance mechanosensitive channel
LPWLGNSLWNGHGFAGGCILVRKLIRNIAAAALLALLPAAVMAQATEAIEVAQTQQTTAAVVEALQAKVKGELEEAALALEDLKTKVDDAANADSSLAELKIEVDKVAGAISAALSEIGGRHTLVAKRVEELGEPPADGLA